MANDNLSPNNQSSDSLPQASSVGDVYDQSNLDHGTDQLIDSQSIAMVQNSLNSLPLEAADTDLIEKEWVTALQSTVASTADDPHKQQEDISKIKTEYLSKRYGKVIKKGE